VFRPPARQLPRNCLNKSRFISLAKGQFAFGLMNENLKLKKALSPCGERAICCSNSVFRPPARQPQRNRLKQKPLHQFGKGAVCFWPDE